MFFSMKNRQGFTLVEILVALSILALIVFTFTPLISSSFSNIYTSGRKSDAIYQAQEKMENKLAEGTTETTDTLTIIFPGVIENIVIQGKQEQVSYTYEGRSGALTSFITKK